MKSSAKIIISVLLLLLLDVALGIIIVWGLMLRLFLYSVKRLDTNANGRHDHHLFCDLKVESLWTG